MLATGARLHLWARVVETSSRTCNGVLVANQIGVRALSPFWEGEREEVAQCASAAGALLAAASHGSSPQCYLERACGGQEQAVRQRQAMRPRSADAAAQHSPSFSAFSCYSARDTSVCVRVRVGVVRGSWRRSFMATKRMEMFYQHLEAMLVRMVPQRASQHLLQVAAGEVASSEWGQLHDGVSILFVSLDLEAAEQDEGDPTLLVQELNHVFSVLDACLEDHSGCYKVETICNIYVVAAGVPDPRDDDAQALAALSCRLAMELQALTWLSGAAVKWKMGAHCGSVFAGKQGDCKPARGRGERDRQRQWRRRRRQQQQQRRRRQQRQYVRCMR